MKPATRYKVIKCPLKKIINSQSDGEMLCNTIVRSNKIVVHGLQFLKLWFLKLIDDNKEFPIVTEDLIKMIFRVLTTDESKKSRGRQIEGINEKLYEDIQLFHKNEYVKLCTDTAISGVNMSGINQNVTKKLVTCLETHIKEHYVDFINKYVNLFFKRNAEEYGLNKLKAKDFYREIRPVKSDLINGTLEAGDKYTDWIKSQRGLTVPASYDNTLYVDLKNYPQMFLKYMFRIASQVETLEGKMFRCLPLRTIIIPHYIKFETKALIEIFPDESKSGLKKISDVKKDVWKRHFNIDSNYFKRNGYVFDFAIETDGVAASIILIHQDDVVQAEETKKRKVDGGKKMFSEMKGLKGDEKIKYKQELAAKKDAEKKMAIKAAQERKKMEKDNRDNIKKEIKDLTNEIKQMESNHKKEINKISKNAANKKIKEHKLMIDKKIRRLEELRQQEAVLPKPIKQKLNKAAAKRSASVVYVEDLKDDELQELAHKKKVYVDPGKRDLLTMMDDDGNFMKYSNKEHLSRTKRLQYQYVQQKYKQANGISQVEETFKENSNTVVYDKFAKYVHEKNKLNDMLYEKYEAPIFRKHKWYTYMNTQRAYDIMLNKITEKFGSDIVIIYGDWGIGKQMRNFISTPNLTVKEKVCKRFKNTGKMYDIDEYNTSKLHHKMGEECSNLSLPCKDGKTREIHAILTCKMENGRVGCINRDKNSVKNMRTITQSLIEGNGRPERFQRYKMSHKRSNHDVESLSTTGNLVV